MKLLKCSLENFSHKQLLPSKLAVRNTFILSHFTCYNYFLIRSCQLITRRIFTRSKAVHLTSIFYFYLTCMLKTQSLRILWQTQDLKNCYQIQNIRNLRLATAILLFPVKSPYSFSFPPQIQTFYSTKYLILKNAGRNWSACYKQEKCF